MILRIGSIRYFFILNNQMNGGMVQLNPAEIVLPEVEEDDLRVGHLLGNRLEEDEKPHCAIVGFPSDEGVRRNRGRPGAAAAPFEIRSQLYRLIPPSEHFTAFTALIGKTKDLGNIPTTVNLEAGQQDLGSVLAELLSDGILPVILGGGHETAFGHFLGYAKNESKVSILNFDAHTDVRTLKEGKAHSGSPFRQALMHKSLCCEKYLVAGLQPHTVANEHLEFIDNYDGRYLFREETNPESVAGLFEEHGSIQCMVTFDMDAVDQAFAPGVSAPCTNGLFPGLWLNAAQLAGKNETVTSFDLSEVNPEFDRDGQTARLAALTVWHFLLGLSQRK